jgi:hypothetical protein
MATTLLQAMPVMAGLLGHLCHLKIPAPRQLMYPKTRRLPPSKNPKLFDGAVSSQSPAATPDPPLPQTTVSQPQTEQSLLDCAYKALRDDDPHLLDRHEKLLSMELVESSMP